MTKSVVARLIPILDVDMSPIGVWSQDRSQSFTESWADLMDGQADPTLSKLSCTRIENIGVVQLGPTVGIQDGALLYVARAQFRVLPLSRVGRGDIPTLRCGSIGSCSSTVPCGRGLVTYCRLSFSHSRRRQHWLRIVPETRAVTGPRFPQTRSALDPRFGPSWPRPRRFRLAPPQEITKLSAMNDQA
jgi:hypothetical protein